MNKHPPVKLSDLEDALPFLDAGDEYNNTAWVRRETGAVFWCSEYSDDFEPVPKDADDTTRYAAVPSRRDLDLGGKSLPLDFVRAHLPDCYDQVRGIFSHRGAYSRFKDLLDRHDSLTAWYQWETEQTRQALREWCKENDITLAE